MRKGVVKRGPKIVSPWLYDPAQYKNSVTGGDSLAVPNQAMSVREIMVRFTRGVPPNGREAVYNEDYETPDLDSMDLVERQEFAAQNAQHIRDLQALADEAKQQAKRAEHQPEPAPAASGKKVGENSAAGGANDGAEDGAHSSKA